MNGNDIEQRTLESQVRGDILAAIDSFDIIKLFIDPLYKKSDDHYRNRDRPLSRVILRSAVESTVSSLSRLLQPDARENECTLIKYKNLAFKNLRDREYIKSTKRKIKKFQNNIIPIRNKILSHSDMSIDLDNSESILPMLSECIDFVEELHHTCCSKLNNADFIISRDQFNEVAENWINCLLERQKRKVK